MSSLVFRHFEEASDSLLEIRRQVYCKEEGRDESSVSDALLPKEEHICVLDAETDEPVGAVSFSMLPGRDLKELYNCDVLTDDELAGTIGKLMLVKNYRGRPFLATSLMFLAYEFLARNKVNKIVIAVYTPRERVISMYERLGMTQLPDHLGPSGKVLMYLNIEPGYELALRKRCFKYITNHRCIDIPYQQPLEMDENLSLGSDLRNSLNIKK